MTRKNATNIDKGSLWKNENSDKHTILHSRNIMEQLMAPIKQDFTGNRHELSEYIIR